MDNLIFTAKLPPDVLYLIRSIRIFGFLEKPLFVDLYKHIESYNIMQGEMLFDIGDSDDSIYTVYSGCISVYIKASVRRFIVTLR